MNELKLKIAGVSQYNGVSRSGEPYTLYTLEVLYNGTKAKVKTFEAGARVGDYAIVSLGLKKSIYGAELAAVVKEIIPDNHGASMRQE